MFNSDIKHNIHESVYHTLQLLPFITAIDLPGSSSIFYDISWLYQLFYHNSLNDFLLFLFHKIMLNFTAILFIYS